MTTPFGGCARCQAYALATPALIDACAEQAEQTGLTIEQILNEIIVRYHRAGHALVNTS